MPKNEFYDYEAKYTEGMTEFILPARLEPAVDEEAQTGGGGGLRGRRLPGLRPRGHDGRPGGGALVRRGQHLPGMTELSDLPAQARAAGLSYEDLVETILLTAVA